jgi:hypothetical protein
MAELNTYGDLKKVIKAITRKQKLGAIVGTGKDQLIGTAVDLVGKVIPGVAAAKTTFDFVRAAFSKPDTKKTNTWLDKLDIDDDMSSIIDDTVENGFLKIISQTIDSESDDTPLESDFNMNAKMVDYLKRTYGGRTITGITEFEMKDRFQQLAGIKEEEIKSADVKSLIKLVDTNTTIKNKLQTVNNAQEVYEFLEYILNTINPKVSGVNVSKLKSIIDNRF